MSNLVDLIVSGLATGAIYALAAIGFTLLWQTSQTINFAQGEFVMLPAFLMLAAMRVGAPFWLAIVVGLALSLALLGLAFKRMLVDPMLRHGVLPLAIATMALSTAMKELVKTFYSAEAQPFPSIAPVGVAVDLRRLDLAAKRRRIRLRRRRGRRAQPLSRPHLDRPADAGRRPESDGRPHRRHCRSSGWRC